MHARTSPSVCIGFSISLINQLWQQARYLNEIMSISDEMLRVKSSVT